MNASVQPDELLQIGALVPRRGNRWSQRLGLWMLRRKGWRIVNTSFPNVPKAIITGGPHTSNWDGYFTLAAIFSLRLRAHVIAKHSLFKWPLAGLLRWMGFIPINRSTSQGMVEATAEVFRSHEQLMITIAPEGTRGNAPKWKTGFYFMALQAGIPIIPASVDYQKKEVCFGEAIMPSGDLEADMQTILHFYAGKMPRHMHRLSQPLRALMPPDNS